MRFCGVAVVVEGYGDKLLREVIDSKDEVWFRGPVVQLINEVDFGWIKETVVSEEGKSRIVATKEEDMCEN